MNVETKMFEEKYLLEVEKELDDKLGIDYEVDKEDDGYFNVVLFEVEPSEIKIIRDIEKKFNAINIDEYFDDIKKYE